MHHPLLQLDPNRLTSLESFREITRFLQRCESKAHGLFAGSPVEVSQQAFHELFDQTVTRKSGEPAVVFGSQSLTYEELKLRSEQLAQTLKGKFEVGRRDVVALYLERSLELIVSILAVARTGAAYLPLDPTYSDGRIERAITVCHPKIILTGVDTSRTHQCLIDRPRYDVRRADMYNTTGSFLNATHKPATEPLVIMFTSGTTGDPKGVILLDLNMTNLAMAEGIRFDKPVLQFGPTGFDASIYEIASTLIQGGTLIMIRANERLSYKRLFETIRKNDVHTVLLPARFLWQIMDNDRMRESFPESVRDIQSTGEALVLNDGFREFFGARKGSHRLVNDCGPTEVHISNRKQVDVERDGIRPTIGFPIQNVWVGTFDTEGELPPRLTPWGVPGEVLVGGAGVGGGYFDQPELTKDRFVTVDVGGVSHLAYKTGDLGMWTDEGLKFEGRIDGMQKHNGSRVVPENVEEALQRIEGIKELYLMPRKDGGHNLFVVTNGMPIDAKTIRESPDLEEAEVPKKVYQLPAIPKDQHGKASESKLQEIAKRIDQEAQNRDRTHLTSDEQRVAAAMFKVLDDHPDVQATDTFLQLGGDSLQVVELAMFLEDELQRDEVTPQEIMTLTIGQLARGEIARKETINFQGELKCMDSFLQASPDTSGATSLIRS